MGGNGGLIARRDRSDRLRPLLLIVAIAVVAAACTSDSNAASPSGASAAGTSTSATTTGPATVTTIPQPAVPPHIPVAPESERVDLAMPTFSDPTNVTNPLFPVSLQDSVLMLGRLRTTLAGVQPST